MATRIIVAVLLAPLFLVTVFFLPPVWLTTVVAGITALASWELLRATKAGGDDLHVKVCTALAAAAIPFGTLFGYGPTVVRTAALLLMCVLFFTAISRYDRDRAVPVEHIMFCMFGGILIPTMLTSLVQLKMMANGRYLVLLPVFCAFLTDTGAYFAGVFLGKHKGITKVSPNKSLEGYIGGILSGGIFLVLYGLILANFTDLSVSISLMALYGLLGSFVTELGDLSFSLIKRQFGVKDYGHLLPGHGGMLDRFDSMTFAAPMLLFLVELCPPF